MYPYAYFIWALASLVLWFLVFWRVPRVRREMLILSVMCAPLGFVGIYFHTIDYFYPPQLFHVRWGIENWILGFTYGGLGAALYELLRFDRMVRVMRPGYVPYAVIAFVFSIVWMFLATEYGLNSVYAFIVFSGVVGVSVCVVRPRLVQNALLSGFCFMLLHTVFYLCYFTFFPDAITWWKLDNVTGLVPLGIPLEEYLYTFAWGFITGPTSELAARLKLPNWLHLEMPIALRYIR